MVFWVICIAMALVVLAAVMAPMLRQHAARDDAPDVAIYKAQLAEIERDLARDVLDAGEAERARTEVARRLIAANQMTTQTTEAPKALTRTAFIGTGAIVIGVALLGYVEVGKPGEPDQPLALRHANAQTLRDNRPDQAALEAAAPALPPVDAPADYLETVAQLRVLMANKPEELQGWELLAYHESELRNFSDAAVAQSKVIALKGSDATIEDLRRQVDLMVAAADGYVSPEAEAVVAEILDRAPTNIAGRYYIGALYAQTARADLAFRLWRPLVESGEDSFHIALARAQIDGIAALAGVEYTAPAVPGPSMADIDAAEDMTAEDRTAMIMNMVSGLADRLATTGGGPAEWARLITAYGVLGDTESAAEIWTEAADVFGADANAMAVLRDAARGAGVLE